MNTGRLFFRPAIYLSLLVYFALSYTVLAMGNRVIAAMIPEDHYFEIVGAFCLLVTSILFVHGFRMARASPGSKRVPLLKKWIYLGLALLFFFGAGEEVSWGQRMFGLETPPALSEVNQQDEFNLHNLSVLENSEFFTADRLFDMFWFSFAVLIPVAAALLPSFKQFASRFVPILYWSIGSMFLYNYLWAKAAKLLYQSTYAFDRIPFAQAVQEIKESNYAIIFVLAGFFAVWDLGNSMQGGPLPGIDNKLQRK